MKLFVYFSLFAAASTIDQNQTIKGAEQTVVLAVKILFIDGGIQ